MLLMFMWMGHGVCEMTAACVTSHGHLCPAQLRLRPCSIFCKPCRLSYGRPGLRPHPLAWSAPAGLAHLTSLRHLASLSLWNCLRVGEAGLLRLLGALSGLTMLSLRGCQQLEDGALLALSQLGALRRLDLRACENLRGGGLALVGVVGRANRRLGLVCY
jgi:hypothetical protein